MVCIPIQLLGVILLFLYLPIGRYLSPTRVKLPYLLRWFDNADLYERFNRDSSTYKTIWNQGWYAQYKFIALRNPGNYFNYRYLSLQFPDHVLYIVNGLHNIGDGTGQEPGLNYIELNDGEHYEYYYIHKWSQTKCFRFRMGWKIKDLSNKTGDYAQFVLVISPWHSYNGL